MHEIRLEDRKINLLELGWNILEQWRAVLIAGLICAVLLPLLLNFRASVAYNDADTMLSEEEIENQYVSLSFTLSLYVQYRLLENQYNESVMNSSNQELIDMAKDYTNIRAAYDIAYATLPANNQEILSMVIKALSKEVVDSGDVYAAKDVLNKYWDKKVSETSNEAMKYKDYFSRKYMVIGFILGIFLYTMVVVTLLIFSRTINTSADAEYLSDVRNYGNIYDYPYRKGFAKFAHDKFIYYRRNKSISAIKIAEDLATKLKYNGKNQVTLLSLGNYGSAIETVIGEQIDVLKNQGIEVNVVNIPEEISHMRDSNILSLETVFVQIISRKTKYKSLIDLINKFNEYGVEIIGTEFIEV